MNTDRTIAASLEAGKPGFSALQLGLERLWEASNPRSWFYGSVGELLVAEELRRLPPGWLTTHDVSGHGWNIDHIVVGPPGVFTINTKCHPGALVEVSGDEVRVRGRAVPYVASADRERADVNRRLARAGLPVRCSALVVVLCQQLRELIPPQAPSIGVCRHTQLLRLLRQCRPRHSQAQVRQIVDVVRDAQTWL